MSDKNNKYDYRKMKVTKNTMSRTDESENLPSINDITKTFDCLKISILNKASRVFGEFNKVTLGPDAAHENGHISDSTKENETRNKKSLINGTTSTRSNITFSIKKILLENELQRKEKVKKAVEKKKKEMERSQREIQEEITQLLSTMAIQREKENAEKLARLEAEEEQIAQQLEIDRKNEVQKQRLRESEEISKKIIPFRESFHARWKDIANISKACRDKAYASRLLPHEAKVKELSMQMEALNEKARTGDLTTADIKMAEIIVQCNDEIYQSFKADIDQIDAMYEAEIARREMEVKQAEFKAQEEALRIKQLQDIQNAIKESQQPANVQQEVRQEQQLHNNENQQALEVNNVNTEVQPPQYPNTPVSTPPQLVKEVPAENNTTDEYEYPDTESLKIYVDSKEFLDTYVSTYQDFVKSDSMKKFKFECQKSLNITINAISHVNREQLIDKYKKLRLFLSGKGSPNILMNPQAEAYSKSLLAQKIVDQGDTTISSKPELAFPFAAIAVALWNDWPDFGKLFLSRFYAKSPFFVPVFLVPRKDQSEEEYYKSLGCKYNENGVPEKPDQFWKRLAGLMYLYASIIITKQKRDIDKPHPHGLANAWRWLAATINIEPRCDIADICATLIYVILEVTGNDLWKAYPNQFPKMLLVINNVYCEKLKSFDTVTSAPISRLSDFLAKALVKGSIPPPKGQLPPNFW